jgi:hypothetical protein
VDLNAGYWSCNCGTARDLARDPRFLAGLLWGAGLLERFLGALERNETRAWSLLRCWFSSTLLMATPSIAEVRDYVNTILTALFVPPPVYRITDACQFDTLPPAVGSSAVGDARRVYVAGVLGFTEDDCCCFVFDPQTFDSAVAWAAEEGVPYSSTYLLNEQVTVGLHELSHYAFGHRLAESVEHLVLYNLWGAAGAWDRWDPHASFRLDTSLLGATTLLGTRPWPVPVWCR